MKTNYKYSITAYAQIGGGVGDLGAKPSQTFPKCYFKLIQ